jgi:DNA-binding Lrp family transcriptional regulator
MSEQDQSPASYVDIKDVDKEALQAQFETGTLSLRELSKQFGMDPKKGHVQIKRLADREGWTQDLGAKIQAKAEAKLAKQALPAEKREAPRIADKAIIEANAEAIVQVRMRHRTDISRGMVLSLNLMAELEHHTLNMDLLMQLGDLMRNPDDKGKDKLFDAFNSVISLPDRIKSAKALSEMMKNYIALEREAYGIKEAEQKDLSTVNVTVKQYQLPTKPGP